MRLEDLHREVEKTISSKSEAEGYLLELVDDAELYNAITKSNHPFWTKIINPVNPEVKWSIEGIIDEVGLKQTRPLLIICADLLKEKPDEFSKFITMFCGWAVRGFVLRTWSKGALEIAVADACAVLRNQPNLSVKDVYHAIEHMIPDDAQFTVGLRSRIFPNKLAKFILGAIENYRRSKELPDRDIPGWIDVGNMWVEHILPKTPRPEQWQVFCDDDGRFTEESKFRTGLLGNLTLLSGARNRSLGNSAFSTKKVRYEESQLLITRDLAEIQVWTPQIIESRQEQIAKLACEVWPVWRE